ncbi:MAG TPA: glycosyltransferase 87 family protein [Marmoricola sp.]|nr:glycosyltransferase 87 family protein [Marmoricola sp.]
MADAGPGRVVAPTLTDPVARSMSEVVGGPVGRHGRPHRWWTPVRVLLAVFTVVFALGLVQKAPCIGSDWNSDTVRYSRMCYSDVPYLYTGRGLAERQWPYSDGGRPGRYPAMEYPVGIAYVAWVASELTGLVATGPPEAQRAATAPANIWGMPGMATEINSYFLITAVLLFGAGLVATWFLAGVHRRRPWDAMAFALSPALLLAGLVNWDLLAVACTAGALWAWSRGRPVWAGVLVGLGTATKLYPLFLLGAFLVVAVRRRRPVWAAYALGGAVLAWLLAQVPAWATGGFDRWSVFWTFNADRGPDLGSLWLVAQDAGHGASAHTVNVVSGLVFAACCVAILGLGLRVQHPPRVAQVAYLVTVSFLLVNKVYSPQYVLWLLPLAVLARPRWRDQLVWQAAEVFYFGMVWIYLGGWLQGSSGTGSPAYDAAIVVRAAAELGLAALVVRDMVRPEHDPARVLDAAAGPCVEADPMTPLPSVTRPTPAT